jgi:DNA-binding CsgD family transcriptional regulator
MIKTCEPCQIGGVYTRMRSPLEHTIEVLGALTTDMSTFLSQHQKHLSVPSGNGEKNGDVDALTESIVLWSACVQDCLYALQHLPGLSPALQTPDQTDGHIAPVVEELTRRELEVLLLLAHGSPVKEVARTLHVSEKTVRNHLSHLYHKLNINDRTQLVIYAFKKGLIGLHNA